MKVFVLACELETRISEESSSLAKPMVGIPPIQ
jgi:hypothetical protein